VRLLGLFRIVDVTHYVRSRSTDTVWRNDVEIRAVLRSGFVSHHQVLHDRGSYGRLSWSTRLPNLPFSCVTYQFAIYRLAMQEVLELIYVNASNKSVANTIAEKIVKRFDARHGAM